MRAGTKINGCSYFPKIGLRSYNGTVKFQQKINNKIHFIIKGNIEATKNDRKIRKRLCGFCLYDLDLIFVSDKLKKRKLEVYIHEFLHAYFRQFNERKIKNIGKQLSNYLKKLGIK